jgi:hypothetical protein
MMYIRIISIRKKKKNCNFSFLLTFIRLPNLCLKEMEKLVYDINITETWLAEISQFPLISKPSSMLRAKTLPSIKVNLVRLCLKCCEGIIHTSEQLSSYKRTFLISKTALCWTAIYINWLCSVAADVIFRPFKSSLPSGHFVVKSSDPTRTFRLV